MNVLGIVKLIFVMEMVLEHKGVESSSFNIVQGVQDSRLRPFLSDAITAYTLRSLTSLSHLSPHTLYDGPQPFFLPISTSILFSL